MVAWVSICVAFFSEGSMYIGGEVGETCCKIVPGTERTARVSFTTKVLSSWGSGVGSLEPKRIKQIGLAKFQSLWDGQSWQDFFCLQFSNRFKLYNHSNFQNSLTSLTLRHVDRTCNIVVIPKPKPANLDNWSRIQSICQHVMFRFWWPLSQQQQCKDKPGSALMQPSWQHADLSSVSAHQSA